MDNVYAFGVDFIVFIQRKFSKYEQFFMLTNNIADPHYALTHIFPFISIFNLVLASEFLLAISVADWLNAILKWILAEHRPFWWVRETEYYGPMRDNKPYLRLGSQTCETGPGSPSGHLMSASCILAIFYYWLLRYSSKQVPHKKYSMIKWLFRMFMIFILVLITLSRLFIATHFPHQCLVGVIFGFLTAHFVLNYWIQPYFSINIRDKPKYNQYYIFNILIAVFMVAFSFGLYWLQKLFGVDPMWSVKLAFKRCPSPEFLHFNSTPFYALVESTGTVLGWALCITPLVERYNKRERSKLVAGVISVIFHSVFSTWQETISRDNAIYFYFVIFVLFILRPIFFIWVIPFISSIGQKTVSKENFDSCQKAKNE